MKTLVRIQEYKDEKLGLGFMSIQILIPTYPGSERVEPIGHISFQRNLNDGGGKIWYAMRFVIETDKLSDLMNMTKIVKVITKNSNYDTQPSSILKTIGAVEYKIFNHEFIPVSKEGENLYDVLTPSGSLHSRIVAPNEKKALKILKKKNADGATVKLKAVIQF